MVSWKDIDGLRIELKDGKYTVISRIFGEWETPSCPPEYDTLEEATRILDICTKAIKQSKLSTSPIEIIMERDV